MVDALRYEIFRIEQNISFSGEFIVYPTYFRIKLFFLKEQEQRTRHNIKLIDCLLYRTQPIYCVFLDVIIFLYVKLSLMRKYIYIIYLQIDYLRTRKILHLS